MGFSRFRGNSKPKSFRETTEEKALRQFNDNTLYIIAAIE